MMGTAVTDMRLVAGGCTLLLELTDCLLRFEELGLQGKENRAVI